MALVASWEVLTVDDVGEAEPGVRKVDIAAIAEAHDGSMRVVRAELAMTPRVLADFVQHLHDEGRL